MKAIITDLDGTLLHSDKSVSDYTAETLKKCRKQGMAVIAATARPERSIVNFIGKVDFDAVITMNGARILLPDGVLTNAISRADGKSVLSRLIKLPDILLSVETDGGIFANAAIPEWDASIFCGFPDLPDAGALYKILVSAKSGGLVDVRPLLTDNTYCTVAESSLVQIMSKTATKWLGICAVVERYGISPAQAVYFGDDNDDLEPIARCGRGIAVANAIEPVLRCADGVAHSNNEDGVAKYIEKNLL